MVRVCAWGLGESAKWAGDLTSNESGVLPSEMLSVWESDIDVVTAYQSVV